MEARRGTLHPEWAQALSEVVSSPAMRGLRDFLRSRLVEGAEIYPAPADYFAALNLCPPSRVRAVILGQDPYHGPGQAHGLSFSVPRGVRIPPSLHNIHKELSSDLGHPLPGHGNLDAWAHRGVLLLNTVLTVERGNPGSHRGRGWEAFTAAALRAVLERPAPCALVLWGNDARAAAESLATDPTRHAVIASAHPAPYSARRGFFGSRPFSRANAFLRNCGESPIEWSLPD